MNNKSHMAEALADAIKLIGGLSETARVVKCTPQAVDQWFICPVGRVLAIEAATGGRYSRYQLRPDVYGVAPEGDALSLQPAEAQS